MHLLISHHLITAAQLSFTAPFAVTSARQHYVISVPTVPCTAQPGIFSASQETTARNIQRGAVISSRVPDPFADVFLCWASSHDRRALRTVPARAGARRRGHDRAASRDASAAAAVRAFASWHAASGR